MAIPAIERFMRVMPLRYMHTLMVFLSFVSLSAMSGILGLTITRMVVPIVTDESVVSVTRVIDVDELSCPVRVLRDHGNRSISAVNLDDRFDWSEELQGVILGSYYIGFVLMHIPGALISNNFGAKLVVVTGLLCNSITVALTPLVVSSGSGYALMVCRILGGALHGGTWAGLTTILAAWVPKCERSTLVAAAYTGLSFGGLIGNVGTGLLLHAFESWRVIFHSFGIFGLVQGCLFYLLCTNSPATHPYITADEKTYLEKEIGVAKKEKPPVPWRSILTSGPVIASIFDLFIGNWAYFLVRIDLNKYMNDVVHLTVRENGIYTSLPFVMRIVSASIAGRISDRLVKSERLSVTHTRKLFIVISGVLDGAFVVMAAYAGCEVWLVGLFFTLSCGAQGLLVSSSFVVPMDLSPNFAGSIAALTSGISSTAGFIVPAVVGLLTPNSLWSEWCRAFWLIFCLHYVKIGSFLAFGSADEQPWNVIPADEKDTEKAPPAADEQQSTAMPPIAIEMTSGGEDRENDK